MKQAAGMRGRADCAPAPAESASASYPGPAGSVTVLFLLEGPLGIGGGIGTTLWQLLTGLVGQGWGGNVILGVLDSRRGCSDRELPGVETIPLNVRHPRAPWWAQWGAMWCLTRIVRQRKVDVIHTQFYPTHRLACLVGLLTGVPVVRTMRGMPARSNRRFGLMARLWDRLTAAHVAISADQLEAAQRFRCVSASKIALIPNGIDVGAFAWTEEDRAATRHRLGLRPHDVMLLGVGRLVEGKDFPTLIRAMQLVRREVPSVRLFIAGDGEQRAALESIVAELGLQNSVRLLGLRRDVKALLAATDVFVTSTLREGFGMAVLEAMAAGRAVVGTRVPGVRWVMQDGVTGVLVPPKDPQAMAQAIVRLCRDAGLREQYGRAGRARAAEEFSIATTVRRHEELYRWLVGSHRKPRDSVGLGMQTGIPHGIGTEVE